MSQPQFPKAAARLAEGTSSRQMWVLPLQHVLPPTAGRQTRPILNLRDVRESPEGVISRFAADEAGFVALGRGSEDRAGAGRRRARGDPRRARDASDGDGRGEWARGGPREGVEVPSPTRNPQALLRRFKSTMCCRCGDHPARSAEEPFCPICVISIKVEVARGLTQLAGYLARLGRVRRVVRVATAVS